MGYLVYLKFLSQTHSRTFPGEWQTALGEGRRDEWGVVWGIREAGGQLVEQVGEEGTSGL